MEGDKLIINGQEYVRSIARVTLKPVQAVDIPQAVATSSRNVTQSFFWQDQVSPDLVWTQFILDSEGENLNWDYMPRPAIVKSYATAKFKPMDMDHVMKETATMVGADNKKAPPVKNTAFGVMTHSALAKANGELLSQDEISKLELTDDMNRVREDKVTVVAWAALWGFIFPETVKGVLANADAGKISVSMERWIKDYDFIYTDANGDKKAIARADAEQIGLAEHWEKRQLFNNQPVLRRSLDFLYGGVASTAKPANGMCSYLTTSMIKAEASHEVIQDPAIKILEKRHSEVHEQFVASSTDEERAGLIVEHRSLHAAIARLINV